MTVTTTMPGLRVAQLADAVGVRPDTIRYYERAGVLAPPPRTATGYRVYPPEAVERLRFVQGCQRLGLRLREIVELLEVRDTGECPCEPAEVLLRRRIDELDGELARLAALRRDLVAILDGPMDRCVGTPWCPPSSERR